MYLKKANGPRSVTLDNGRILSVSDLPNADTRWVASRKETVVLAVTHGLISRDEALKRYQLSVEEYDGWCRARTASGRAALKVTTLQRYREPRVDLVPRDSAR
ncbi:DUF1153 domain-containing protein [Paracoccus tibetensis]|uniref:CtrA inhibitor SciP n=1 Tax=Paracoccus tibetensis TaxID=336292 RepID=UPI000B886DCD|nr:DUF1153 domain-containing protein [Paracoccus tibetensis]